MRVSFGFQDCFIHADSTVRSEVFRLRKENKELRGQICDSRMKYNQSEKFSRTQRRTYQDEIKGLIDVQDDFSRRIGGLTVELRSSRDNLQQALQDKVSLIQQKELELEQVRGDHRKLTKEMEELQQALYDLRKLR